jgi:hypothetical protein
LTDTLCVRHAPDVVLLGHHRSGKAEAEVRVDIARAKALHRSHW